MFAVGNWAPQDYNHVQGGVLFDRRNTKGLNVAISGSFTVNVRGRARSRESGLTVQRELDRKVLLLDPDAEKTSTDFAGVMLIINWVGIPKDLTKFPQLMRYIKVVIKNYFIAVKVTVKVEFIEKVEG